MVSGFTGNEVPLTGLWVRIPCPPLFELVAEYPGVVLSWGNADFSAVLRGIVSWSASRGRPLLVPLGPQISSRMG